MMTTEHPALPGRAERIRDYRIPASCLADACGAFRKASLYWDHEQQVAYTWPQPTGAELDSFYAHDYRRVMGKQQGLSAYLQSPNYLAQARSQLSWLAGGLPAKGRWLDVGAGFGLLIHQAKSRFPGWTFVAAESDEEAVTTLRQLDASLITPSELWGERFPADEPFDVITLSHVLEHLADPWRALRRLRTWLRPEGSLLVEVPNDSREELERPDRMSDLPHLWFFSMDGLRKAVASCGFIILRSATLGVSRDRERIALYRRLIRGIRTRIHGPLSLLEDPYWYTEGPARCDIRVVARRKM